MKEPDIEITLADHEEHVNNGINVFPNGVKEFCTEILLNFISNLPDRYYWVGPTSTPKELLTQSALSTGSLPLIPAEQITLMRKALSDKLPGNTDHLFKENIFNSDHVEIAPNVWLVVLVNDYKKTPLGFNFTESSYPQGTDFYLYFFESLKNQEAFCP